MEPAPSHSTGPRKMKYKPKPPPRRAPKPEVKSEVVENVDATQAMDLLQRFNANQVAMKSKAKVEKKVAPSQVAFGYGGASSSMRSYGISKRSGSNMNQGGPHGSSLRDEEEYKEPWDYYSNYPTTLPLRRPYSGNPERLNEMEFGEDSETMNYDENAMNPAEKLGLLEENLEPSMFFVQLPQTLPMKKPSAKADGHQVAESSKAPARARATEKVSNLKGLPAGQMGKLLVYKSGVVKLKLGDTLYDVNPGMNCSFAQDVVAINTAEKQFCVVGELNKRAIITPDVDSILNNLMNK